MKKIFILIFLVVLVSGCTLNKKSNESPEFSNIESVKKIETFQFWPLAVGNYWDYQGVTVELENGTSEIKQKEEIIEVTEKNGTTTAIVKVERVTKNFALNAGEKNSLFYYAIKNQDGKKYYISGLEENIDTLKKDMINIDNSFFRFELPLSAGKRWDCKGERTDNYCWTVISTVPDGSYVIEYPEASGHTRYTLKEGIGVTKYKYHHNGTFNDEILFLVDYKINN